MGHSFQDVLCRVLLLVAMPGAMLLEVLEQGIGILANGAKVYRSATLSEEQEIVEFLKKYRARLVDGRENGLAAVRELSEETYNSPGAL